mmetsp:Transcript_12162/g.14461  ORF Transcript_12162/g.14461 Transcript_12162/m.14461 type:complete len:719 (-) Transcript_12162:150-2306(-)|eukprot:CAMPEP_0197846554 /NCGR_PEP_ID=MMETSP1438-20131217/3460_1 /TAXON_ID=1461541 /ORGANISM="Pterosperma sp., Strain CCMP1384" /LENGTH=718 /DNA_ID=CAMNT_0043458243 /DNA_START=174 /DNA_END=2330 /DNA_ORIENTATION=-
MSAAPEKAMTPEASKVGRPSVFSQVSQLQSMVQRSHKYIVGGVSLVFMILAIQFVLTVIAFDLSKDTDVKEDVLGSGSALVTKKTGSPVRVQLEPTPTTSVTVLTAAYLQGMKSVKVDHGPELYIEHEVTGREVRPCPSEGSVCCDGNLAYLLYTSRYVFAMKSRNGGLQTQICSDEVFLKEMEAIPHPEEHPEARKTRKLLQLDNYEYTLTATWNDEYPMNSAATPNTYSISCSASCDRTGGCGTDSMGMPTMEGSQTECGDIAVVNAGDENHWRCNGWALTAFTTCIDPMMMGDGHEVPCNTISDMLQDNLETICVRWTDMGGITHFSHVKGYQGTNYYTRVSAGSFDDKMDQVEAGTGGGVDTAVLADYCLNAKFGFKGWIYGTYKINTCHSHDLEGNFYNDIIRNYFLEAVSHKISIWTWVTSPWLNTLGFHMDPMIGDVSSSVFPMNTGTTANSEYWNSVNDGLHRAHPDYTWGDHDLHVITWHSWGFAQLVFGALAGHCPYCFACKDYILNNNYLLPMDMTLPTTAMSPVSDVNPDASLPMFENLLDTPWNPDACPIASMYFSGDHTGSTRGYSFTNIDTLWGTAGSTYTTYCSNYAKPPHTEGEQWHFAPTSPAVGIATRMVDVPYLDWTRSDFTFADGPNAGQGSTCMGYINAGIAGTLAQWQADRVAEDYGGDGIAADDAITNAQFSVEEEETEDVVEMKNSKYMGKDM